MDKQKIPEWWSDPGFWCDFEPLMFDKERMENAAIEVDGVIALSESGHSGNILDVGCGPGRHSIEFARRGFRVTGIDIHQPYLSEAEIEADSIELKYQPEFINCDMRKFYTDATFTGAVSLFQSLGYFDEPADDLTVCRNVYSSLEPEGWFIVEMDGKEAAAASFEERIWFERDGRIVFLEYEAEAAWTRLRNKWSFRDRDGTWHEYEFSYRLYSAQELGRLLSEAGFVTVEFFGSLDGRPYDQNARRLVALARKP